MNLQLVLSIAGISITIIIFIIQMIQLRINKKMDIKIKSVVAANQLKMSDTLIRNIQDKNSFRTIRHECLYNCFRAIGSLYELIMTDDAILNYHIINKARACLVTESLILKSLGQYIQNIDKSVDLISCTNEGEEIVKIVTMIDTHISYKTNEDKDEFTIEGPLLNQTSVCLEMYYDKLADVFSIQPITKTEKGKCNASY